MFIKYPAEVRVWVTSDLHIGHGRGFIQEPRGFETVEEMNEEIVKRFNELVGSDDEVYILGDLMLGDNEEGIKYLKQLHGHIHVVLGNHDTEGRESLYRSLPNVVEVTNAATFKYRKIHFYCSHYPTLTGNLEKESIYQCVVNLYGHTHQKSNFYQDIPFMYHVGVDSHNCYPVSMDMVIADIKEKVQECKDLL